MSGPDFDSIKHLNPYNVEYWMIQLVSFNMSGKKKLYHKCNTFSRFASLYHEFFSRKGF